MAAIDNVICNTVLDALAPAGAAVTLTVVGPLKCRLMTANGTGAAAGTELATGGGYTAGGNGIGTVAWNAGAANAKTNSAALTLTNMPACTLAGVELPDSAATVKRVWFGPLTGQPITVAAGNTFSIAAGSLSLGLS